MSHLLKKHIFGILGLLIGFSAIGIASFQDDIRLKLIKPEVEEKRSLKELAIEASKKYIKEKLLKEESTTKENEKESIVPKISDSITYTYYGLGLISIILGIISFIRKENSRLAISSFSCGLIAVAWTYVMYAVGVAIIIIIISGAS